MNSDSWKQIWAFFRYLLTGYGTGKCQATHIRLKGHKKDQGHKPAVYI